VIVFINRHSDRDNIIKKEKIEENISVILFGFYIRQKRWITTMEIIPQTQTYNKLKIQRRKKNIYMYIWMYFTNNINILK